MAPQVSSHGHVNIILSFAFYAFFLIPSLSWHGPQFPCENKGLVIVSTGGSFPRTVCYYDFSCVANEVVVNVCVYVFWKEGKRKRKPYWLCILSWTLTSNMIHWHLVWLRSMDCAVAVHTHYFSTSIFLSSLSLCVCSRWLYTDNRMEKGTKHSTYVVILPSRTDCT